jgi:hypothetical protein
MTGWALLEFHGDSTDWTLFNRIVMLKTGNTLNTFMGIVQIVVTGVAKVLVSEKAFGTNV